MPDRASTIASLMITVLLASAVHAGDAYLEVLEAEARKLAPGRPAARAAATTSESGDRAAFEAELKKHKGTYSFYGKLQEKDRAEVFKAYEEGASFSRIRKMIIDRNLHR